jgi:hypothetical protein
MISPVLSVAVVLIRTTPQRHITSLCLLSRRPRRHIRPTLRSCLRLAKAMIALASHSIVLRHHCATSQPGPRKSSFWRHLYSLHCFSTKHLFFVPRVAGRIRNCAAPSFLDSPTFLSGLCSLRLVGSRSCFSRCGILAHQFPQRYGHQYSGIRSGQLSDDRTHPLLAAHPTTLLSLDDTPRPALESHTFIHSSHSSTTSSSGDQSLCQVCGIASNKSCSVCDQRFCSNHLYFCSDCDNQYCGNCLDDHRADGHWSDSDTAAELNHTQWLSNGQATHQRNPNAFALSARNQSSPSWQATLERSTSLLVFMLRLASRSLSCCSATALKKFSSHPIMLPEVCL